MTRAARYASLTACIALVALVPATAARSQSSDAAHGNINPIDGLKQVYLECERRATRHNLDTGEIMQCSVVYEELKRRAFGGEFKLLRAWADEALGS